jgi:hypothetical protein
MLVGEPRRPTAASTSLRAVCLAVGVPLPEFRNVTPFSMVEVSSLEGASVAEAAKVGSRPASMLRPACPSCSHLDYMQVL